VQVFRKIRKTTLVILLPAVLLLLANSILNRHNHLIQGYLYSHAHPYHKGESTVPVTHTHTDIELVVLDLLTGIEVITVISLIFLTVSLILLRSILTPSGNLTDNLLIHIGPPRAPPVLF
jgi:hypothetical protein